MPHIRAVVIDDDKNRREALKNSLPDYIECITAGYGEGAIDYIKRDGQGILPDLVILSGDDRKNFGLYIFDWMINKSGDDEIASIPVVVVTDDEFSERSLEFLELGDVTFFEGDIDDSALFSVITQAIEEAEFMPNPVVTAYEETKNIDRLMGRSVKAPGGKQRAVVLDMDNRVKNLEAALARGQKRVNDIRMLLDAAQNMKSGKKKAPAKNDAYVIRMSSFLEKARKKANVEEELMAFYKKQSEPAKDRKVFKKSEVKMQAAAPKPEPVPEPKREPFVPKREPEAEVPESIDILKDKAFSNPFGAFNAQGSKMLEPKQEPQPAANERKFDGNKKFVVIVDDDLKTRKLCSLFLTQKYNVIALDSGIKAVDYFIKNRADLLIINPVLKGMSGMATVNSVLMQPGGMQVAVMYLVGENYTGARSRLLGQNVVGILNKPIKQGLIAQAVDGYFDNLNKSPFPF
ncbi:MAG: response regulator [Lachnospiraceae bacterium]|nr:response regulator [Lachnospiraceae bacterium]